MMAGCAREPAGPTVILISIDGFRSDYVDLAQPPHLDRLIANGVRAELMEPVYPANTFPNHYTIVTGLYPENHGIVDNNFYDPELEAEFGFKNPATFSESRFWQGEGEPLWVTVERQGGISAAVFGAVPTSR